jgi:hypothetical protein
LDPALLGVVWGVAVEAHADSLVAQELLFGVVVAECELEFIQLKVLEAVR